MIKKIQELICNYDQYREEIQQQNINHSIHVQELQDTNDEERTKRKAAEKELKKLLEQNRLDILELKNWYYTRFSRQPSWYYNAYSNGTREVSGVIRAGDQEIIKKASEKLIKDSNLNKNNTPEEVIENIAGYFMKRGNWTYVIDNIEHGVREYWAPASKSWETRRGDCDSLAILMHNLIHYMFKELKLEQHYWRLKFTAMGTLTEAHAFNIWLGEDGEWYVLESTLDLSGSFKKTWLRTPLRNNNLYTGNPWGFADREKSWRGLLSSLQPYHNNG